MVRAASSRVMAPELQVPPRSSLLPERTLSLAVPPEVHAVALELLDPEQTLDALCNRLEISAELPRAVPKRRAEFAAGRHAAALALGRLAGLEGSSKILPRGASGSPCWPAGFCGSISHGAGLAVALVARTSDYQGLGVDVERLISEPVGREIEKRILNDDELARIHEALPLRTAREHLSLGFSAKESLYKCLNPLVSQFIEFEEAHVSCVLPETLHRGSIALSLTVDLSDQFRAGFELWGCYAFAAEHVETTVYLARSNVS